MSTTANRIIKNTGFLYVRLGLSMFISLWTTRIVLNALGSNDFGIYNVVGGAIAMLGFLNASMAVATQRFLSYYQGVGNLEKCKEVFHASVILHAIISAVLIICFILTGWLFFNFILNIPDNRIDAAHIIYGSLVISTAFTVMTVPYDATLNAHENMRYYAIIGILESSLKLIVAFIVVYVMADKLIVYGVLMASISILLLAIMRFYCYRHYPECRISLRRRIDKGLLKEMTSYTGWNLFTSFSSMFTQYGLGIVLNHFYGALLNAAHGIANQLSGMLMAFSSSMLRTVNPVITKSEGHGDRHIAIQYAMKGSKYSFIILSFFAIPFIAEMDTLLKLWLRHVPDWAVLFCVLQLLRTLIEQLTVGLLSMIRAHGKIKGLSIMRGILNIMPFITTVIAFSKGLAPFWMYVFWISFWSVGGGIVIMYLSNHLFDLYYTVYLKNVIIPCLIISIIPLIIIKSIQFLPIGLISKFFWEVFLYLISFIMIFRWVALTRDERLLLSNVIHQIKRKYNGTVY